MSDDPIDVFIADDHAMVREGLAALVSKDPGIRVVGQCGDGLAVVEQVLKLKPRVLVLDITMPGLNGLDICRELIRKGGGTSVLILTMHDDEQFVADALKHGASGYLLKESAGDRLTEAIRRVARGELYLGPGISQNVIQRVGRDDHDPYDSLTARERQVLQMIAEGKTNRKIAEALGLAVKTVDTHRTRLMRRLNIHNQTALVKYVIRRGMVSVR